MQSVIDWVTAHWGLIMLVVYELWSLIPEDKVKSSSILTLLASFIKKPTTLP